jgi:hypothetical protein
VHSSCILPSQSTNQPATDILFPTHTHDPGATIHICLNPSTKHFSNTKIPGFSCRFCCIVSLFHHIKDYQRLSSLFHPSFIIHHIIHHYIHHPWSRCPTILGASHYRCLRSEFIFRPPHALTALPPNQHQPTRHHLLRKESSDHTATMTWFLQSHRRPSR